MIDYQDYRQDGDFMTILNYIRYNCLAAEDEVADGTSLDLALVRKHYRLAQAIVAEELDHGIEYDPWGASMVRNLTDYLLSQRRTA